MDKATAVMLVQQVMQQLGVTLDDLNQAPPSTYPKVVNIQGVNFTLVAPINPKWQPSSISMIIGGKFSGTTNFVLHDPSNASGAQIARSPGGYPYVYGTPGSIPRIQFSDQTFADDAEVENFIAKTTLTPQQLAEIQKEWEDNMSHLH